MTRSRPTASALRSFMLFLISSLGSGRSRRSTRDDKYHGCSESEFPFVHRLSFPFLVRPCSEGGSRKGPFASTVGGLCQNTFFHSIRTICGDRKLVAGIGPDRDMTSRDFRVVRMKRGLIREEAFGYSHPIQNMHAGRVLLRKMSTWQAVNNWHSARGRTVGQRKGLWQLRTIH